MGPPQTSDRGFGRRIAGRYRLTRLINSGGSGSVWVAVDEVLGREVAVKDVSASPYLGGPDRRPVPEPSPMTVTVVPGRIPALTAACQPVP